MPIGTVVRWGAKGYGFIRPRGGGRDVFVHIHDLGVRQEQVETGTTVVEFDVVKDYNGRCRAIDVRIVNGAGASK